MPLTPTYPGVYIEELPSSVHTITGASTSNTAFIDFFARGPVGEATRITSYSDFERFFGGLDKRSAASYQIRQYYLNGGSTGFVVRVAPRNAAPASAELQIANLVVPQQISLGAGEQQTFSVTTNGEVAYSLIGDGSIDAATGVYTAPAAVDPTTTQMWETATARRLRPRGKAA